MKIVVAPDKFKGSLPATQVAAAIAAGLHAGRPGAEVVTIPVADGGEGTVDAAVAAGYERVPVTAAGPAGDPVRASYARRGEVALIVLAGVCGLARLPGGRPAPLTASSFGAGEVLRAALEAGARKIILGVGGSASTDGGAGLLQALGARILDTNGEPVRPGGAGLREVAALDLTGLHRALYPADIILAADVDNPLTGPDGAAEVYGPQKGASPAEVAALDAGLRRWAAVVAAAVGRDWSRTPGAGAAGGVGFAALAVLGATRRPGIELVLDLAGFETALDGADLVITGEGSLDAQSLAGKTPVGVARAAARRGIAVVAVAGRSTLREAELAAAGIAAVYPLTDLEPDLERCRAEADRLLRHAGQMIARDRLAEVVTGA
ncbi:MAG TPA: glycerate kinase [Mycobacteriales bacterium]|nr:glycerate kinase [Mycobacteriales bacterium]